MVGQREGGMEMKYKINFNVSLLVYTRVSISLLDVGKDRHDQENRFRQ